MNRNGSTLSRGFSRSVSRVVSRKRIVDFTEQRCPVLDRPRIGLSAIMEKHRQEDPGNEIAGECWVLLNSGIAITIETPWRYLKCDVGAGNENADMANCSVVRNASPMEERLYTGYLYPSKQVSSCFPCYASYVCKANQMSPIELNFNRFNPRIVFELSSTLNQIDKIIKLLCTRTHKNGRIVPPKLKHGHSRLHHETAR